MTRSISTWEMGRRARRGLQVGHGAADPGPGGVGPFGGFGHAAEHGVDASLVLRKRCAAFVGGLIELAAGFAVDRPDEALVFQQRQGGIDHAGAGPVGAARAVFQFLDQLVAVARLLGDQGQDHEAKVAVLQEPADPTAAMASMRTVTVAFAHTAAPGMTAALFAGSSEKMMVSMHIESPLLLSGRYRYI